MHYFLRISSLSPSPMVSGQSGSSRHVHKPMIGYEKSSDGSKVYATDQRCMPKARVLQR